MAKTKEELKQELDAAREAEDVAWADRDAADAAYTDALTAYHKKLKEIKMAKTRQELQADLEDDIGRYLVGHIDDLDVANRVLAVFKKVGIKLIQDTYESLEDAQWHGALRRGGHWGSASNAGLFNADLSNDPTNALTNVGFRCVARPAYAVEIISAETFLLRFEG